MMSPALSASVMSLHRLSAACCVLAALVHASNVDYARLRRLGMMQENRLSAGEVVAVTISPDAEADSAEPVGNETQQLNVQSDGGSLVENLEVNMSNGTELIFNTTQFQDL